MSRGPLHARLAAATAEAHERLHAHPGFAAAASGRIGRAAYRDLLARLYGFYAPLEARFGEAPAAMAEAIDLEARRRRPDLEADLAALGFDAPGALARRPAPDLGAEEARWLGSLYVTEGSTLGGAHIARALGAGGFRAHAYFEAYGDRRGAMWRMFLARLERLGGDAGAADAAEAAARTQFEAFDGWMRDWDGAAAATCAT